LFNKLMLSANSMRFPAIVGVDFLCADGLPWLSSASKIIEIADPVIRGKVKRRWWWQLRRVLVWLRRMVKQHELDGVAWHVVLPPCHLRAFAGVVHEPERSLIQQYDEKDITRTAGVAGAVDTGDGTLQELQRLVEEPRKQLEAQLRALGDETTLEGLFIDDDSEVLRYHALWREAQAALVVLETLRARAVK